MTAMVCAGCGAPPDTDEHGYRALYAADGVLLCWRCMDAYSPAPVLPAPATVASTTPSLALQAVLKRQERLTRQADADCALMARRMHGKPISVRLLAVLTELPQSRVRAMLTRMEKQGVRLVRAPAEGGRLGYGLAEDHDEPPPRAA